MYTLFMELTWWQAGLLLIYITYTIIRALQIYNEGTKEALIGDSCCLRLYHILRAVIDIPALILGTFFPILKKVFSVPIAPLKTKKKGTSQ